jgi:hypothetical protein
VIVLRIACRLDYARITISTSFLKLISRGRPSISSSWRPIFLLHLESTDSCVSASLSSISFFRDAPALQCLVRIAQGNRSELQ